MNERRSLRQQNPYAPYDGWRIKRQKERRVFLGIAVVLVTAIALMMTLSRPKVLYAIYVNQRPWVYVRSEEEAKEIKDFVVKKKTEGKKKARLIEQVAIKQVPRKNREIDDRN